MCMSPDDGARTSPPVAPVGRTRRGGGASGSSPVLMVALLALGAVLGAVGWDILEDEGRSRGQAASSLTTTTTAPSVAAGRSDEDRLICIAALERSVEATELVGDGLEAVAELRRADLDRVLNRLQQLRPGLRSSAEQCRKILQG